MIFNFLFHRVHPDPDPLWSPMHPALFEKCIRHIKNKFQVVSMEEAYTGRAENRKKLASISFDDGYLDNLEYAVPILKKYHVPASFFIISSCASQNIPTWTYIFDYSVLHTKVDSLQFTSEFVPEKWRKLKFSGREEFLAWARQAKPWLKSLSSQKRKTFLKEMEAGMMDVDLPKMMMSWGEIQSLSSAGFEIGSHSHSHEMLANLESENDIEEELKKSFDEIKKHLGRGPEALAYPIGSYDERVQRISKKVGYKRAFAVNQCPDSGDGNPYEIPRIELYNESWWKCKVRMSPAYYRIKSMVSR